MRRLEKCFVEIVFMMVAEYFEVVFMMAAECFISIQANCERRYV